MKKLKGWVLAFCPFLANIKKHRKIVEYFCDREFSECLTIMREISV